MSTATWTIDKDLALKIKGDTKKRYSDVPTYNFGKFWPLPDAMSGNAYDWAVFDGECEVLCGDCGIDRLLAGTLHSEDYKTFVDEAEFFTFHPIGEEFCCGCCGYMLDDGEDWYTDV